MMFCFLERVVAFVQQWHDVFNVAIGLFACVAALCAAIEAYATLREIAKQTAAALLTANETQRSVNALINSERAWIIVEPMQEPLHSGSRWETARMKMINNGRSAARLEAFGSALDVLEPLQPLTRAPLAPETNRESELCGILTPGESRIMYIPIPPLSATQTELVIKGLAQTYCHGFVTYIDHGNQRRSNRFCFEYVHNGRRVDGTTFFWRVAGPPNFIEHT